MEATNAAAAQHRMMMQAQAIAMAQAQSMGFGTSMGLGHSNVANHTADDGWAKSNDTVQRVRQTGETDGQGGIELCCFQGDAGLPARIGVSRRSERTG